MAAITLRGVTKRFGGGTVAVTEVDLAVGDGEFCVLVGPSGSGKSTLLRLVAGLETPTGGRIEVGGRDVTVRPPRDRDLAMVFQDSTLYPHLSVFDNLAFSLRARGASRDEVRARVASVVPVLGLGGLLDRRPETLSGGEAQRVALGRAVVRRPSAFLFDEPLSRLDAPLRAAIRGDLLDLHRRLGATMLYVTHDQAEALALGDRVAVMAAGRILQVGPPRELYEAPASRFVAEFLGSPPMSILPARVVAGEPAALVIEGLESFAGPWPLPARRPERLPTGPVWLGLRPEHVRPGVLADPTGDGIMVGTIRRLEYLGHETIATLMIGAQAVTARLPAGTTARRDEPLPVRLDLAHACWFDPATGLALPIAGVATTPG